VTVVAAIPDASVATDDGARTTPPPPETLKLTIAPETAWAAASETFTEKIPTEVVTAPFVAGADASSIFAAGPTFGAEESEPHAPNATSAKAPAENRRRRITVF